MVNEKLMAAARGVGGGILFASDRPAGDLLPVQDEVLLAAAWRRLQFTKSADRYIVVGMPGLLRSYRFDKRCQGACRGSRSRYL